MKTILETPRLVLREMTRADLDFLEALLADEEVMRFYPQRYLRSDAEAWLQRQLDRYARDGYGGWLAVLKETNAPVGQVGLVRMLVEGDWDAVWTVSPTDSKAHPLKQLVIEANRLDYYDPKGAAIVARQQLEPVYHRNGVAYVISRRCLVDGGSLMGPRTGAYVIEGETVSIDTLWDLELAELLQRRREAEAR